MLFKILNHRDPTLMTMLYLLQQLLKKRIDLSIRQEGAQKIKKTNNLHIQTKYVVKNESKTRSLLRLLE